MNGADQVSGLVPAIQKVRWATVRKRDLSDVEPSGAGDKACCYWSIHDSARCPYEGRGGSVSANIERPMIMTVREVAGYLRMHEMTIYRMARQGEIPAYKVGNRWRFNRERLEDWLRAHEVGHERI